MDTTTSTDLGTVALSSSGMASVTVSNLPVGPQVIEAIYAGQGLFLGSSGTLTQQVDYGFGGFLLPLSNGLQFGLNRTIPIKFQLSDASGNPITSLSAVTSLLVAPVVNGVTATPFAPASTNNQGLQSTGGHYQFNWQTNGLAGGTYRIQLTLADGTVQTKTLQLVANGNGNSGLVADGSSGSSAGATAGGLLGGDLALYVDNSAGNLTGDELAAIDAAVGVVDAIVNPFGVNVTETTEATQADVVVSLADTTALGGAADGVLGCESDGLITLVSGWSWYAGTDPAQIGAGQYDFETVFIHELGHSLGPGHSTDATSGMYPTLAAGTADRALTAADLNVADTASGACGLHAAVPPAGGSTVSANPVASQKADPAPGSAPLLAATATPTPGALESPASPAAMQDMPSGPATVGLVPSAGILPGGAASMVVTTSSPGSGVLASAVVPAGTGLAWQWASAGDRPAPEPAAEPWDLMAPAQAGDVPPVEVSRPAPDSATSGSGGDGQTGDASSWEATTDGDAWFFPADEGGSEAQALPVGWDRYAQEQALDPEDLRAAQAAVFAELG
jgi:hypothetical protein